MASPTWSAALAHHAPANPSAEEKDRSLRNPADKRVRSPTASQAGDMPGDKKDENLHPWRLTLFPDARADETRLNELVFSQVAVR